MSLCIGTNMCQYINRSHTINRYIESLKTFLAEQSPNYGYTDAKSLLDALFYYYTEANPIDGTVIRCQFRKLDSTLSKLSLEECNQVFSSTVDLSFPIPDKPSPTGSRWVCVYLQNYNPGRQRLNRWLFPGRNSRLIDIYIPLC